jgi:iron complex outermembrane receptor protein
MKTAVRASLLLFAVSLPLSAADVDITVVTPARTARSIAGVPGSVEVVTATELESAPGATLDDKLAALVPGLVESRLDGIYSFNSVVTLRGLPASDQGRTLILLDGVPVNTGATGAVNWNRLSMEEIDRIEVFKGPVSSLYGSNAAAGVINVITRKAAPGYKVGTSYGTYKTLNANAGAGARIKNLSLSVDGGYLSSDGYNSTPAALRTPYTVNKYAREKDASAKASLYLGEAGTVDAQYSRNEGLYGEVARILAADGVSRGFGTDFARAAWHGDNGSLAWQTQLYYQLEDYSRLNEAYNKAGQYARVNTDAARQDTGGQAAVSLPLAGVLATLGADYKLGSVDAVDHNLALAAAGPAPAAAAYDDRDRGMLSQYAPYVQAEKKLFSDRLNLLAALRYDNASYFDGYFYNPSNSAYNTANGDQGSRYWDSFSPKIAASWQYSTDASQYISYGKGFRPPSLEDMCLTLLKGKGVYQRFNIANPGLKPETVYTAETGFSLAPLRGLYIDPAAYYTEGRNFMYTVDTSLVTSGGVIVSQKQNIAEVRIYGAELPVKFYSGPFSLAAAWALSDSEITGYTGSAGLKGKTLTYAPRSTVSAELGLKTVPADFALGWLYKSRQYTLDDNSAWVAGYSTFSASASRALSRSVSAKLSVANIFDKRYQESSSDLAPGRTVTLSAEAKF